MLFFASLKLLEDRHPSIWCRGGVASTTSIHYVKFMQNLKALQILHNRQILQQYRASTTERYKTQSEVVQAYTMKKLKCNTLLAEVKTTVEKQRNFRAEKSQQIKQ